jgi:hypothetical protein
MIRPPAAFIAACLGVMLLAPSAGRAMPDMSAPVAWSDTGAEPFVQRDAAHHPTAIGLVIPAALAKALPAKRAEAIYPLERAGLVRSANLQWHPTGHEPAHVYDVPHFDVHFFTITEDVRHTILPGAAAGTVRPRKANLPPGAFVAPGFVPMMGMHAVAGAQPEFNHGTFGITPIVGYWNGDVAFFEVMFTKAWLLRNIDKEAAFPQPASVRRHGWYPTRYTVSYDKEKDAYTVALTHFLQR